MALVGAARAADRAADEIARQVSNVVGRPLASLQVLSRGSDEKNRRAHAMNASYIDGLKKDIEVLREESRNETSRCNDEKNELMIQVSALESQLEEMKKILRVTEAKNLVLLQEKNSLKVHVLNSNIMISKYVKELKEIKQAAIAPPLQPPPLPVAAPVLPPPVIERPTKTTRPPPPTIAASTNKKRKVNNNIEVLIPQSLHKAPVGSDQHEKENTGPPPPKATTRAASKQQAPGKMSKSAPSNASKATTTKDRGTSRTKAAH